MEAPLFSRAAHSTTAAEDVIVPHPDKLLLAFITECHCASAIIVRYIISACVGLFRNNGSFRIAEVNRVDHRCYPYLQEIIPKEIT